MIETLLRRREEVRAYFIEQVSPLEPAAFDARTPRLRDMALALPGREDAGSAYEVRFCDGRGREIAPAATLRPRGGEIEIAVSPRLFLEEAEGHVRIDVRVSRAGRPAPRAAQFHVRSWGGDPSDLVGVVH